MKTELNEYDQRMKKSVEHLDSEFAAVRAGRANVAAVSKISVDYYGVQTPLQQMGAVSTPDPRTLVIQPWDTTALGAIEKAILASDLGINPQNDGKVIRLAFPQLTEERRKELAKQVRKYGEECKVAVRNIRRDAMEGFKDQKKSNEMTEDDLKDIEKDLQKLTDQYIKQIDTLTAAKEKDLSEL